MSGLAFVFVFSVTDPASFSALFNIVRHVSKLRWEFKDMPMIIIGTKADLIQQRKVSIEEAKKFADEWAIKYQEISVSDIKEVNSLMESITKQIIDYRIMRRSHPYKKPRCIIL
jgi:GTPase SAR1 family protein